MPLSHQVAEKLPAVSGSSGQLRVQGGAGEPSPAPWPGQVFEEAGLSYEEAMLKFVAASQEPEGPSESQAPAGESCSAKAVKQALRQEQAQLREERRQLREIRRLQDAAWHQARADHKAQVQADQALSKAQRLKQRAARQARQQQWQALRQQRRLTLQVRQRQDQTWRQKRQTLRERGGELLGGTSWVAILVIIDNCTRQSLGLPLFVVGAHVTAEMIVAALRHLLPPELQFLISDRGPQFRADLFKQLVDDQKFIHVRIARHRPQSNGIAERFVRTLKAWLKDKSWQDEPQLAVLLQQFLAQYNDRPHQGLPWPGLSPNEFANRSWLM